MYLHQRQQVQRLCLLQIQKIEYHFIPLLLVIIEQHDKRLDKLQEVKLDVILLLRRQYVH